MVKKELLTEQDKIAEHCFINSVDVVVDDDECTKEDKSADNRKELAHI